MPSNDIFGGEYIFDHPAVQINKEIKDNNNKNGFNQSILSNPYFTDPGSTSNQAAIVAATGISSASSAPPVVQASSVPVVTAPTQEISQTSSSTNGFDFVRISTPTDDGTGNTPATGSNPGVIATNGLKATIIQNANSASGNYPSLQLELAIDSPSNRAGQLTFNFSSTQNNQSTQALPAQCGGKIVYTQIIGNTTGRAASPSIESGNMVLTLSKEYDLDLTSNAISLAHSHSLTSSNLSGNGTVTGTASGTDTNNNDPVSVNVNLPVTITTPLSGTTDTKLSGVSIPQQLTEKPINGTVIVQWVILN